MSAYVAFPQITELVHQRDVTRSLIKSKVDNAKSFEWLSQMRFYFDPKQTDVLQQLSIQMANAKFNYGFEYLGVQDKLVQTPLTDRCYLTMTQALEARLGGSPFGETLGKPGRRALCGSVCLLRSSIAAAAAACALPVAVLLLCPLQCVCGWC